MITIQKYVRAESLEEAWTLNQNRRNRIAGGMLWTKLSRGSVGTLIDLSTLGLDTIEETENEFSIGAMVTLRQLELHEGLNTYTSGLIRDAVKDIVGVQFRNLATVGGSIYGRFGFSDVLTLFMAIGAKVELYNGGVMSVEAFTHLPREHNDILVSVIVPKNVGRVAYLSQRNAKTDFPVLTCAVCESEDGMVCAVGARPALAECVKNLPDRPEEAAEMVAEQLQFGSNLRAGAEYRRRICRVLVRRAMEAMGAQEV